MDQIFTPVLVRCLSGPLSWQALLGPIDIPNSSIGRHNLRPAAHPTPLLSHLPTPFYVQSISCEKSFSINVS